MPVVVASRGRRVEADELSLVLLSQGLHPAVRSRHGVFDVEVPEPEAAAALSLLERYRAENRPVPPPPERPTVRLPVDTIAACAAGLVLFHLVTGASADRSAWFVQGGGDAARILQLGEGWRTITALTLHADWGHVLGNALFGALFFGAVGRAFGGGFAGLLVLCAGAAGNLLNAWVHGAPHRWVGASTAVFAAVGILAGLGISRYGRSVLRGRRAFVPVAAGLGLVAMLGTSPDSDVWAHVLGFFAGIGLGWPAARLVSRPPGHGLQRLAGGVALGLVVACWYLAFARSGSP